MNLDRRKFVFSMAALAFAAPAEVFGQVPQISPAVSGKLTDGEKEILGFFCDQIIPKDDYPGARELGVVSFIHRTLTEAHPDWLAIYRSGLRLIDLSCRRIYGKPFAEVTFEQQTDLLKMMEKGESMTEWTSLSSKEFFSLVRSHTMQGYYSHPRWGGNRNKQAWDMIGYADWWV